MTQKNLLSYISARLGWEESNVIGVLEAFMDIVRQEVVAGNRVDVSEFGLFQALRHPEYILIEAETGERYLMPPSVEVVFEPAIITSDSETPDVASSLHFIPDASFEEEANSPFALFEPTLVNEGVHFPNLTEVVVNEPKAAGKGYETEKPAIPDTSEVPQMPQTSESHVTPVILDTLEVPDMVEVNEVSEPGIPSHQRKRLPLWIPILGGAVVALLALLFSRHRDSRDSD
jgi:DNA-binding protein HU-beta